MNELKKYLEKKSTNQNKVVSKKPQRFFSIILIFIIIILVILGIVFFQKLSLKNDKIDSLKNLEKSFQEQINDLNYQIEESKKLNEELSNKSIPLVEVLTENDYCLSGYEENTKLEIKIAGEFVATHNIDGCFDDPEIVAIYDDSAYFAFLPEGIETGYIYGSYIVLYRLNLLDYSLELIFIYTIEDSISKGSFKLRDIDFSKEGKLVYNDNNSVVIYNINNRIKELYDLPSNKNIENIDCRQFGDFKFSEEGDKVAIAVAYRATACDIEYDSGEIYIFDLNNKTFTLYKETEYFVHLYDDGSLIGQEIDIVNFN